VSPPKAGKHSALPRARIRLRRRRGIPLHSCRHKKEALMGLFFGGGSRKLKLFMIVCEYKFKIQIVI